MTKDASGSGPHGPVNERFMRYHYGASGSPKEQPDDTKQEALLTRAAKQEALAAVLTGAWHALKSYEYGNSSPDLAAEMARAIEGAAKMLGVTIEGLR
jgi:hypothetical protein